MPTLTAAALDASLSSELDSAHDEHHPTPPTEREKYQYLSRSQHRWFWWAHLASFIGVAFSLYGFARMTYWTMFALAPLAVYLVETLLGLWTSTFKRSVTPDSHAALIRNYSPTSYPSVDVFLPTAGEDVALLANTYRYVSRLRWPGELKVWVLDDYANPDVAALAAHHGFGYFARTGSEFKKAGNLRYAHERTSGDHILILDADFVPRSDALLELVPYMDDLSIGIVQSPQYFSTPQTMHWLQRGAGATQEIFYRFIQVSRDNVSAAVCCGTSAVYRRAALDAIGGFPKIGHSEDMFTGTEMHRIGYTIRYVPIVVSRGICPDDIDGFISQQYRWCEGSIEMLTSEEFAFHPTMSTRMRASFWSGFFYYGTTAMNAVFAPIPFLIMMVAFPEYVHAANFIPLAGLFMLWLGVYPRLMKSRWRLQTLRVQAVYSFAHAVAIFDVLLGKTSEWVPSHGKSKKTTPLAAKVRRFAAIYLGGMTATTVAVALYRLSEPQYSLYHWWAGIAFLSVNVYVMGPVVWLALPKPAWLSVPLRDRLVALAGNVTVSRPSKVTS